MQTRIRNNPDDEIVRPNLLPVMNVMFLLIPALLLAMETASMASISVTPPRTSNLPSPKTTTPATDLRFKVQINSDGFALEAGGQPLDPIVATSAGDGASVYDYAALEASARELKNTAPEQIKVEISAEQDIEYGVLISAMDALRGSDCKLAGAGEEAPKGCYFWAPVIESH